MEAIRTTNSSEIDRLSKENDLNQPDQDGFTPLMYAVELGILEDVNILLKNGASPNVSSVLFEHI